MRHVLEVADWVEASASHFVGTFVGVTLAAILALIGAATVARWVWRHTRDDVLFLADWALAQIAETCDRCRLRRSAAAAASAPVAFDDATAGQCAGETFGPLMAERRGDVVLAGQLPKRVPKENLPDGLSTTGAHRIVEELIAWVRDNPDPGQPGGAQ